MKNFWKQFAAWGIGSEDNEFIRARLKLTAWYLLSLAAIVAIFSIVLYWIFSHEIRENIERTFTEEQYKATDEIVIVKTTTELQRLILIIDAFILMAAGGLSWLLAGRTLIPIRKALEAQRQFSADASHELRTPLAIMQTNSEVVLRNTDATVEQCRRVVESNLEEVGRMSTIVEDLLTLSRTGEWGDQMVAVDLSQLAVRIGEKMKSIARSKHITLSVVKNSTAIIRGNPTQLERMLYNLVHNAITYTPEGGDIEVRVQAVSDSVRLTVKDTGVGIDAKDLPHVFERFYRSGRSETYPWSGAGLGLSIVKGIVLEYQGNIDIESTVGKGTKVSVTFPAIT